MAGEIMRVQQEQVDAAGDTLALAFADDPVFAWMTPRRDGHDPLQRWFRAAVREETRAADHIVDTVSAGDGVAVWHEVDRWKSSPMSMVRTAVPSLALFRTRLPRALRVLVAMERSHPEEPHRHLLYLGVHPQRQGQGLGAALLSAALDRCDAEGVPAYLENTNPRNEPLYARFGFERHHLVALPAGAPPLQAMWRNPR